MAVTLARCSSCSRRLNSSELARHICAVCSVGDRVTTEQLIESYALKLTKRAELIDAHTPSWAFTPHYSQYYHSEGGRKLYRPSWSCKCNKGWDGGEFYSKKHAEQLAWNAFMSHKFGQAYDEADSFSKLWDECFPNPHDFWWHLGNWPVRVLIEIWFSIKAVCREAGKW